MVSNRKVTQFSVIVVIAVMINYEPISSSPGAVLVIKVILIFARTRPCQAIR